MVEVRLVPRPVTDNGGREKLISACLTAQDGVSWRIDHDGNLHVQDKEGKPILVVARGEWQSAAGGSIIDKPPKVV